MPTADLEQICNIAGYSIYPWAANQLKKRSEKLSEKNRSQEDLIYFANKNSWIRVVSSVDLIENESVDNPGASITIQQKSPLYKNYEDIIGDTLPNESSLAEKFVLYGGTSQYTIKPSLTDGSMNLRYGLGGSYGMLGDSEIKKYGYRPMPGITSMTVESTGKMGSLRTVNINLKVWDKSQLDIIDALYFRPGFTILIEWGHTKYFDNLGKLNSSEMFMIGNPFKSDWTKEELMIKINTNTQKSLGNYGGFLATITQFNFAMTSEGGYDCTIKALALGALMDNMKINHPGMTRAYENQLKDYLDRRRKGEVAQAEAQADANRQSIYTQAIGDLNNTNNLWAQLQISDPFQNLLFNTGHIKIGDHSYINTPDVERKAVDFYNKNQNTFNNDYKQFGYSQAIRNLGKLYVQSDEALTLYKSSAQTDTDTWISKYEFSKPANNQSSTADEDIAYYIEGGSSFTTNNAIFFKNINNDINGKYIAPKQFNLSHLSSDDIGDIHVTLDIPRLLELLKVTSPNANAFTDTIRKSGDSIDGFLSDLLTSNYYTRAIKYGPDYKYAIGIAIPKGINNPTSIYDAYNNSNTKYKIEAIDSNINGKSTSDLYSYIKLSAIEPINKFQLQIYLGGADISEYQLRALADLSLIKTVEGPQPLSENKPVDKYNQSISAAQQDYDKDIKDKKKSINAKYNIDQFKSAIESESAIELMLKSIMLYVYNNPNQSTIKKEIQDQFYKDLFSEGAYSTIFPDGRFPTVDQIKAELTDDVYSKYINGGLDEKERLKINTYYGNSRYLMSGENAFNVTGNNPTLKNHYNYIKPVDFEILFTLFTAGYNESLNLEVPDKDTKQSIYITLGSFLMMLNHTGILYNRSNYNSEVITPMAYIDFNPETNFFLSNKKQFSIDPEKFLIRFTGDKSDYDSLFDKDILSSNGTIYYKKTIQNTNGENEKQEFNQTIFDPETDNIINQYLPLQNSEYGGLQTDGYVGKFMNILVDINYLLKTISGYAKASDNHEVYFQSIIQTIIVDLNKYLGGINAFRLAYNDNANCYIIVDDQVNGAADTSITTNGICINYDKNNDTAFELPIYGVGSIVRSFELRTDISNKISNLISIAANPVPGSQVSLSKDTSDFGIYNYGTRDRFKNEIGDAQNLRNLNSNTQPTDRFSRAELAINFDKVVRTIYGAKVNSNDNQPFSLTDDVKNRALNYYIEKMAHIRNQESGNVHAMIIPVRVNITMDGISSLYPFQLFTIDEGLLPYRYSRSKLSTQNFPKRVAFSIGRISHNFQNSEWTTTIDGFMTILRNSDAYTSVRSKSGTIPLQKQTAIIQNNIVSASNVSVNDIIRTIYIPAQDKALPNISKGIRILMQAQAQVEGFGDETNVAYKTNNPGNVRTDTSKGTITSYLTLEDGIKAQWNQVLKGALNNTSRIYTSNMTLFQYLSYYAPPSDPKNNPVSYTNTVIGYFKSKGYNNIDKDTTLQQINNLI